jgi:hypothetical protein
MSNKRKLPWRRRVAKIELPSVQTDGSNNWIEYRDKLMAGDRFAVQEVVSIELGGDKSRAQFLMMQNDMRNALLGRIITGWSFPVPIPSQNSFQAADIVIGNAMDLKDYAVLEKAVDPLMDLIQGRVVDDPKKPSAS